MLDDRVIDRDIHKLGRRLEKGAQRLVTIAMCYLSPEGIVIGADSTSSVALEAGYHYFNFNQKVFEIGENSTIGAVTWGLGGVGETSYRTLFASLADTFDGKPPGDMMDVSTRWSDVLWPLYSATFSAEIAQCLNLHAMPAFDPNALGPVAGSRTRDQEGIYQRLKLNLFAGFCFAGYVLPSRRVEAYQVSFDPLSGKPTPARISINSPFWGAPNMIRRLIWGHDVSLRADILASGKWTGSTSDLDQLLEKYALLHPPLPIRDAIDFVHACITSTIKALKFSSLSQICGGPVELAVITTDRKFRWVRHKEWDAAIRDGVTE